MKTKEVELVIAILERVYNSLEKEEINGENCWTDGGRFIISLTDEQMKELHNIINK